MIFIVAIPVAIIWIFGFPILIVILLAKNKKNFNDTACIIKYGLFYIGLKDDCFYWEVIIINIRKICCTAIAVVMQKSN